MVDPALEHEIEQKAKTMLADYLKPFGLSEKDQHLLIGSVRVAVLRLAEQLKVDLMMVGSHAGEHHGIKQFSGSRANAILHHAASDVLIVETSFRERKDNKLKR